MVRDIHPGSGGSSPSELTSVAQTLYFGAPFGRDLWKSDGTAAGTARVKKINPSGPSFPQLLTAFGSRVLFTADDGVHGRELWISDGTAAGTRLVRDINPGPASGVTTGPTFEFAFIGTTAYFGADDGLHGFELWRSDGSETGTTLVRDINPGSGGTQPSAVGVIGDILLFSTSYPAVESGLWRTDGTETGTTSLGAARPSGTRGRVIDGVAYFEAFDKFSGSAGLWRSDGTDAGTFQLKELDNLSAFEDVRGTLFFIGADQIHGFELWKSNGTPEGTVMVKDINPGPAGAYGSVVPPGGVAVRGGKYFFAPYDGVHPNALWKSDGTEAGTVLVKEIAPGNRAANISQFTVVATTLYFTADDGVHGNELWRSTGSASGTSLVADLNPAGNASPAWLTRVGSSLFFTADDGVHGRELWRLSA